MSLNESLKVGIAALALTVVPACGDDIQNNDIVSQVCTDTSCGDVPECDAVLDDFRDTLSRCFDDENPDVGFGRGGTDLEHCIKFSVPDGWTVDTDEDGQLSAYRQDPYLAVTFFTHNDKASWQTWMDAKQGIPALCYGDGDTQTPHDTLVSEEDVVLQGFPTKRFVLDRDGEFQYAEYFVDAGTMEKWFQISSSDPTSTEIDEIVSSIEFTKPVR